MVPRTSRILGLTALLACTVFPGFSGCVLERETTLSRAARLREVQAMEARRERLERELEILVLRTGELGHEIAVARAKSVRAESSLRATLAALDNQVARLVTAEQDLAAAQERAKAIEQELQPLRDLEKTLAQQEALRAAAAQRVELLRQEVATAEAEAAKVTTELQPKLENLRAQLEQAQEVEKAIGEASAAVQAAAKVLAPPPEPTAPDPPKK